MLSYYGQQIIFFSCSLLSIHEICIFWLLLSDMINCVSYLMAPWLAGSLSKASQIHRSFRVSWTLKKQHAAIGLDLLDLLAFHSTV